MIALKLPMPPSLWQCYARKGARNQFRTPAYKAFQEEAHWAMRRQGLTYVDPDQLWRVEIVLHSSTWRNKNGTVKQRDADNYVKPLLDTIMSWLDCNKCEWDDSSVWQLEVHKKEAALDLAEVWLIPLDEEGQPR